MAKFEIAYTENNIVLLDKDGNKAKGLDKNDLELFAEMSDNECASALRSELRASQSGSRAGVVLVTKMLQMARMDGYKGTCPVEDSVPNEAKAALRDCETLVLRPALMAPLLAKGAKQATADTQVDTEIKKLNAGSSYAVAKGVCLKYFAYTGNLPMHNGKYLTVAAIKKLIENIDRPEQEKTGIAGKLVALSLELRKENSDEGNALQAIAALKDMLAFYTAIEAENAEAAQAAHEVTIVGDVEAQSKAIIDKAVSTMKRAPRPETAPF